MITNIGFTLSVAISILQLTIIHSTREGTLDCVKIQRTYQWAVYLKCSEMNREFCWFPCETPKSFSDIITVSEDCRCNPIDERRKRRFLFLNKNLDVPNQCFKPTGTYQNWFQECILDQQPSLQDVPVIAILNNVLQNGKQSSETKLFYQKLMEKFKPVVVHVFKGKKDKDDMENMINKKFKSTMRSFACGPMNSLQTANLYDGILNIISQIGPDDFANRLKDKPCLLIQNTLRGQRFIVATTKTYIERTEYHRPSKNTIHQISQKWKENNIRYVVANHVLKKHQTSEQFAPFTFHVNTAQTVYAWIVDSSKTSVILHDIENYYLNNNGDDSRVFIDIQGETKYCTTKLGCIQMSIPYEELLRHELLPESLHLIQPHLWRYTSFISNNDDILDEDESCLIGDSEMLFLVIHGFTNSGNDAWVQGMKDAILSRYIKATVIVVDWKIGAAGRLKYYKAAVNTHAVGAIVAEALQKYFVKPTCINADNVHIIGHSLGAQTAGFVGDSFYESTKKQIGMITGLDPAGPWFEDKRNHLQLEKTDAKYVQILHTSARSEGEDMYSPTESVWRGEYGIRNPMGHIDFYFNGGYNQPSCSSLLDIAGCSHSKAFEYFTESITSDCKFIGFRCNGENRWEQVENCFDGNYNLDDRAVMDINDGKRTDEGLFFVATTDNEHSFCNRTISSMYPTNR